MKILDVLWLLLALAVVVLAAGLPYWRLSYAELNKGQFAVLPGALLLAFLSLVLVLTDMAPARRIVQAMLLAVPIIVSVSIARDTAIDPTSHNLWPLELLFAAIAGAAIVLPAVGIGLSVRWALARLSPH
ncbi:putative membrane protein YfhO [Bradyrhizobium sp. USDA 4369]